MIIKLVDKIIKVNNLYQYVEKYCKDYLVSEEAGIDYEITITAEDIAFERARSARENEYEGLKAVEYADEYLETLAVYRKLTQKLLACDVLLFHGSVVAVDEEGYLFTAKSGTGKSTHTRLWREVFGDRAIMINDDKPLLRIAEDGVWAYGTPWDGKHRLSSNTSVKLKALVVLNRGKENMIQAISIKEAFPMLVQQSNRGSSPLELSKTLELIDQLSRQVSLYSMHCNMEKEAAIVAYNGMQN